MDFLMNLGEGSQLRFSLLLFLSVYFTGQKVVLHWVCSVEWKLNCSCFGFGIDPGKPAIDVMLTILAVVVTSATLQTSGGLDVMLQIAEKNASS